jgi:hypothetical protein
MAEKKGSFPLPSPPLSLSLLLFLPFLSSQWFSEEEREKQNIQKRRGSREKEINFCAFPIIVVVYNFTTSLNNHYNASTPILLYLSVNKISSERA